MSDNKSERIAFRLRASDAELLRMLAEKRGEDCSTFARRALKMEFARLGYLGRSEQRALGFIAVEMKNPQT